MLNNQDNSEEDEDNKENKNTDDKNMDKDSNELYSSYGEEQDAIKNL